jgi:hypothetical protein
MTKRLFPIVVAVLLAAACGATPAATHARTDRTGRQPAPVAAAADVQLVRTLTGVSGVTAGTDTVVWSADGAVSAADGSAVFGRAPSGELTRLDPTSGVVTARWDMAAGLAPVLVEPGGDRVLLSDRAVGYDSETHMRPTTRLQLRTGPDATIGADLDLAADLEPEAFALGKWDPTGVFVLDHRGDHYRVQRLDLATGGHDDVSDRDKEPGEDMRGRPVHGVMDTRGRLVATLYVNPDDTDEPAFVHVLNLGGTTYCVDLPAEFAQGPVRSQTIERTADDVIVVRAPAVDRAARFDLRSLDTAEAPPPPGIVDGAGVAADAPYRSVPGFVAMVG